MANNNAQTADISKIWWKVKEDLKKWKDDALSRGTNPDALLFYYCGHGGADSDGFDLMFSQNSIAALRFWPSIALVGYVPIESSAVSEEFGDTHIFSGTVGNTSVDEEGVPLILSLRNNSTIKYVNMPGWEY